MGSASKQAMMQIFVRQVSGDLLSLSVSDADSVLDVRRMVCEREGADEGELRLLAHGLDLEDDQLLSECVTENATLEAMLRLRGGGKKRKKKTYLKPKKIKHKHIKMARLKCYKVDGQGKIIRLRVVCSEPMCGPGVFMANHFDRQYCGKCHVTYKYDPKADKAQK